MVELSEELLDIARGHCASKKGREARSFRRLAQHESHDRQIKGVREAELLIPLNLCHLLAGRDPDVLNLPTFSMSSQSQLTIPCLTGECCEYRQILSETKKQP
jgi:hypothetical protein